MPTFHEIAKRHPSDYGLDAGLNIRLTDPAIIEALRKYASDNRDQNGCVLTKDEAVTEILFFFLIGSSK